jgi:dihydroorotase
MLSAVVPYTVRQCWGAVVMPNTATPHIETPEDARAYKQEIIAAAGHGFYPALTCYLTPHTDPKDLERGFKEGDWGGAKVYPPGATTNSTEGVPGDQLPDHPGLATMERIGMPLLLHPEVNREAGEVVDIYDREKKFIDILRTIRRRYPRLRISIEHVTSSVMARYVVEIGDPDKLVCTITAHHLLRDRRDLHEDGWQPHLFCYPILKRKEDKEALRRLATAGYDFVSAGTDSAPHPTHAKEKACGCAGGVFTAHAMVELYAQVFDEMGTMHNLEKFLCINGPRFYGLEPKKGVVVLKKEAWKQATMIEVGDGSKVRPFGYHEDPEKRVVFPWRVEEIRSA